MREGRSVSASDETGVENRRLGMEKPQCESDYSSLLSNKYHSGDDATIKMIRCKTFSALLKTYLSAKAGRAMLITSVSGTVRARHRL